MNELITSSDKKNLDNILDFIADCLNPFNVSIKYKLQLNLAIEEIFVNIVEYGYGLKENKFNQKNEDNNELDHYKIKIQCEITEDPLSIIIRFIDKGIKFNPLGVESPDISSDIENRRIGGLGLFLVKKNVDDIKYEYKEDTNILTIWKNLFES